jgi:hypothetical protein
MAALLRRIREAATRALLLLRRRRMLRRASQCDKAPWSELPPELLGLVFSCLPSQADRVRLRAVCRPWRSAARLQPLPPPLPLLVLRGNTLLTLPDGTLHRLPFDWDDIQLRLCTGGMLFLKDRFCRFYMMMDPFPRSRETTSQMRINLYERHTYQLSPHWIRKVVVSHHTIALLHKGNVHFFPRGERSYSTMEWAPPGNTRFAFDIALFRGKLYVLAAKYFGGGSQLPELHRMDVISHKQTRVSSVQCIQGMPRNCVDPGLPAGKRRSFFLPRCVRRPAANGGMAD